MNCPICNKELQLNDTFCPECGFEIHFMPNEVSDEIVAYEQERERKYKEMIEKHSKEVEDLSEQLSSSQKELESQKKEAEAKATSDHATKDQLTQKIDELTKELEQRTEDQNKANQTSEVLREKNKQLEAAVKRSKAEVEKLKEELGKTQTIDGIVRVVKTNDSGGVVEECYLLINQGLNTYGSGADQQKNHHTIGLRRTPIASKHFSIEKNQSGQMILRPLNGEPITCDGRAVPATGLAVERSHIIKIGNTIEIHISIV